jgi:fatty acid/phospholipid biosynthesis enzyme
MTYEVKNQLRSKSVITVVGSGSQLITLSQLEADARESVQSATITSAITSTDGIWTIRRGNDSSGTLVLDLVGNQVLLLSQYDIVVSNGSSSNIYVTNSGSNGTLILTVGKNATYSPALTEM